MRELQAVIEALAERLHRAVAIDDPSIRLLAHTAHDEKVDEHRIQSIMTLRAGAEIADYVFGLGIKTSTKPVRIPGRADLKVMGRLCVPVRCQGILLGYLWLIDDDQTLTKDDIAVSVAAAEAAGEILFRARLLDDLNRERERRLLLDLFNGDQQGEERVSQADLDAVGLTEQLGCRVVVVDAPFAEDHLDTEAGELSFEAVLRRSFRRLDHARTLVATRSGGKGYVLVAFRRYEDPLAHVREVGQDICAELRQNLPGATAATVGIGPAMATIQGARESFQRAGGVVEVCGFVPEFAPVSAWEDLGIYRLLQQLPLTDLTDVAIPPGLRALLEAEADQWLVETLDTYLDSAGNVQESAKRLHIHRATLYYRLARIEQLTGMSLADGQDRLALHLGVKVGRLTGAIDPANTAGDSPHHGGRGTGVDGA
ncbi:PucR family transcriptional regulator [Nocardioides sp.]|uniref:PucR family transcriptional regulator n=1 Tax=Nocardioides sp. TaxID=35761 RepID=UPI003D153443